MNRYPLKAVLHLSACVLFATTSLAAQAPAGDWLGALDVGPTKLRLALHVEKTGDGGFSAILDSIDQGAKIPVDTVVFENGTLRLALKAIGASYEGTLNVEAGALEGLWSQGARKLPLVFHRQEEPFALKRPQLPKGPFPYESREVTFHSEAGGVPLAGTLLLPAGKGPFPAVALVTGSGPQDRDETVLALFAEKDFQVEAQVNAEAVRAALAAARNPDHEVRTLAGLNHLFQHAGTGGMEEYGTIEETFAPEALDAIGDWIVARFPRGKT